MSILYRDILYPILEELQYDKKSLASCFKVSKTWCEIVIPILWRNPWDHLTLGKKELLLNKLLFNYISYCRHLNLEIIEDMFIINNQYMGIRNNILKLFINKNVKYTHLYIPGYYDYHLIPGTERCFSEIKFLKYANTINTESLTSLIKNSGEKLTKIRIFNSLAFSNVDNNKKIIQTIYQSSPNLIYLELYYKDSNILELEKLLIKCQYLNKLEICSEFINWNRLFNILTISSPPNLFKFKIYFHVNKPKLKSLKLFFDNWEGRHPMSLIIGTENNFTYKNQLNDLINNYKAKGVVNDFTYYDSETKEKNVVKDLKTETVDIFNGFKKLFN
ncbi:hypothetical protein RhiirA5_432314 [Rhizophagus irregularis]|uniref:F-box domain-containing protein n=1 Tax=Rhizophagus irregularis TaxID=588596 RepID=A0A2N0NTM5_9GLOM|nr:hypothetical protein RhiirA5_432314 [Rhizophagus irregularis]